jgi:uncharacterized membrane protein YkgB
MANYGIQSLRISMGIIFIWFGVLKFFKGYSPAEDLAVTTIHILTFNLFTDQVIIYGLAFFETLIGLGLAFKMFLRETLLLLFIQMIGTITPVFLLPDQVFNIFPFSLTLEGQYIVKNLVLISAGIVIGATVRGGKIESN